MNRRIYIDENLMKFRMFLQNKCEFNLGRPKTINFYIDFCKVDFDCIGIFINIKGNVK